MTDTTQSQTPEPDVEPQGDVQAEATATEPAAAEAPKGRDRRSVAERLEREGEIAADYLETLLDVADLDGDLDVDVDGDRAAVSIVDSEEGRVPRRLVGRDGEVLEALQELARLAVLAQTGERSRLMLDVGGHRSARRESLVARARRAADQVRARGGRLALEAMSPVGREVRHRAGAAPGLPTASAGVAPQGHVD